MSRLQRLARIAWVFCRYRLDLLVDRDKLPSGLALLLAFAPWRLFPSGSYSRGERLRLAMESLGPVFVKFGQVLSTRRDLLPDDIIDELARLQDQVPPFPSEQAIAIIEAALGNSVNDIYAEFSPQPLASASVAQVHTARLKSGEEVVVKVIRPGIERVIRQDIKLLFTLAQLVQRYVPDGRRLRPVEVVEDYQHTLIDELDLQREGANTAQLRRNFEHSPLLYIPTVYWDYSNRKVLTSERIDGIPVTDVEALKAQNTNLKLLAERGVEIFFTQVFRDNFFHADMHPGNVFVSRQHPEKPQYIGIDCAIIGSLSESDQYYLARNLFAIFERDYRLVAELHVESGWVSPDTQVNEFEGAIRSVSEPIFQKPIGEISFGQLLIYLFQTARRFDMEVQPSLVLLQKTLLNIEGLGRELYPDLNLWDTAKPFLEQWLKDRYSPKGVYKRAKRHLPAVLEHLPKMPELLIDNLQHAQQQREQQEQQQQQLLQLEQQIQRSRRRTTVLSLLLLLLLVSTHHQLIIDHGHLNPIPAALVAIAAWLILRRS